MGGAPVENKKRKRADTGRRELGITGGPVSQAEEEVEEQAPEENQSPANELFRRLVRERRQPLQLPKAPVRSREEERARIIAERIRRAAFTGRGRAATIFAGGRAATPPTIRQTLQGA